VSSHSIKYTSITTSFLLSDTSIRDRHGLDETLDISYATLVMPSSLANHFPIRDPDLRR
jgi:hypothetical protein